MLNYLECSIKDFNEAMNVKDEDVKNISSEYLYILFTKYSSDYRVVKDSHNLTHKRISKEITRKKELYKQELNNRGIEVEEQPFYVKRD